MTRVKICGITRAADGLAAAVAGADAIGLVFYPPSSRNVSPVVAADIIAALPPYVTCVGLFVDPEPDWVRTVLASVALDLLQFHGAESPAFCAQFDKPYMKALRVRPELDLAAECRTFEGSRGILLDTFVPGEAGGTGRSFDWSLVPPDLPLPVVLAGGLTATNVAAAISRVRPWAVDVSGGVESERGIKDPEQIKAFMRGVQSAQS